MTLFPSKAFADPGAYLDAYAQEVARAFESIDREAVQRAAEMLEAAILRGGTIHSCGNGGSAAIANHLVCDYMKGIRTDTDIRPRVVSLSSNIETVTAIANDIGYEDVFLHQLTSLGKPEDVLIAISSSGGSPNVVRALRWARDHGLGTIAFTGFSGGPCAEIAEISIHVAAENYGVAEDVHQSLMHLLAQYLRQKHLSDPSLIGHCRF